jgi:DNA (cytosine-5)-methyltransferase 1
VFWENVPGVLNTKDNAFGCFLGALAGEDEALIAPGGRWTNAGFIDGPQRAVAWRVLDAQYFGVAQRRRRVFVVASAREDFDPAEVLFEFEGVRRDTAPSREAGQRIAPCVTNGPPFSRTGNERVEAEAMVVADCGVEISGPLSARDYKDAGTDGMNKISAKMVPVIHETVGALCADSHPGAYSGQDAYTGRLIPQSIAFENNRRDGARLYGDVSNTLQAFAGTGGGNGPMVAQPAYAIQGNMIGRNDNAGPQGDGVNEELCFTQNTIDRHAVANNMAVRRLTPTECERLQGFPDGYTNIPWRKAAESPDGPRYKALGNSWAVPVVRWIGERIARAT